MGVRGRQPQRGQVQQERRTEARPVEENAVDDPRRDKHNGENRRCA